MNDGKPLYVVDPIMEAAGRHSNPTIACLGVTYKADVQDARESAAVKVVHALAGRVAGRILAVELDLYALPGELAGENVELVELEEALEKADVVALLVDHSVFRAVNRDLPEATEIIDLHGL